MSQLQLPKLSTSNKQDESLIQFKRKRARAVCKQLLEPEIQKACRLIASRMERIDNQHDWVCVGVQQGTDTQSVFTSLQDFAEIGNHKFTTFNQDDLTFGILGVRKQDSEVAVPPSPPKLKLKRVDQKDSDF